MSAIQADAQAALAASSSVINASQPTMPATASDVPLRTMMLFSLVWTPWRRRRRASRHRSWQYRSSRCRPLRLLSPCRPCSSGSLTYPSPMLPAADTPAARTGTDLFKLLRLVNKKVKGDGSCWDYAIMACAGLRDHAHTRHRTRIPALRLSIALAMPSAE